MKWLINKAFLTPSVEQPLRLQADSWASKTIIDDHLLETNSRLGGWTSSRAD